MSKRNRTQQIRSVNKRKSATVERVSARYDAAQTTADNRRHFANADLLDPVRANTAAVRSRLRKNARYEIANNSYAKGIVLTLANDVIGTGPRLQMMSDDSDLNRKIELEFAKWAKSVGLAEKLRTMKMAKIGDGEAFAMLVTNNNNHPATLDIKLIEADQVESPWKADGEFTEGIKFDSNGSPKSYSVLKTHPGGLRADYAHDEIDAKHMIHWFRTDRPGQIRGIPEITAALPLFAHLRRFTLATVVTAELLAEMTLYLKTNMPPEGEATEIKDGAFEELEVSRGMMTTLPEGWEPYQLKAEQPGTTYDMFKREILNEIARCLNIPYNIAACNSSSYNYASGRLDHQTYFKSIRVEENHCEMVVIDRIFNAWLDEARYEFQWQIGNAGHTWFWDGSEHVDPQKEANAQSKRLESNTTNLAIEFAKQGRDWEQEVRQRALEISLCRELGLSIYQESETQELEPATNDDDEED